MFGESNVLIKSWNASSRTVSSRHDFGCKQHSSKDHLLFSFPGELDLATSASGHPVGG